MNAKKKEELLKDFPAELLGTRTERVFLEMSDPDYVPMWISAAKPVETVLQERTESLREESKKRAALEVENAALRKRLSALQSA
jgi:hypothetical protein